MTKPCNYIDGCLEREDEVLAHTAECESCRALWAKYQRMIGVFPQVGAAHEMAPDFEARMWATVARSKRRRWQWLVGLGAPVVAAAILLLVLIGRGPGVEGPLLAVEVIAGDGSDMRADMHQVGDLLVLRANGGDADHGSLRVYRNDSELLLQCPGDAGCQSTDGVTTATLRIEAKGTYEILWLTSDKPLPAAVSLSDDAAAATGAGARYQLRDIQVY